MIFCRSCNGASKPSSTQCDNCGLELAPVLVVVHMECGQGQQVVVPARHMQKVRSAGWLESSTWSAVV